MAERGERMMKVGMNINPDVLEEADKQAKSMGLSRSAYVTMCIANFNMQRKAMESMPTLKEILKKIETMALNKELMEGESGAKRLD
jgi:metal-responsive CopG/Arc/MetJ family transcriptional regulator